MIMYFLQRVSIACYAERCTSYSKSVCLSVRLSHAGVVEMHLQFSASKSPYLRNSAR